MSGSTRGPSVDDDPVAAWQVHSDAVQALLDDPATPAQGARPTRTSATCRCDEAVDRFYTADVFMHTWDLARATGQDETLDAEKCAELLAGMEPMDDMLRASGQYGPRVEVPERRRRTDPAARVHREGPLARRVAAHEGSGHRRRRLHRVDHGQGAGGGRAHAGHPRLAAERAAGLRPRPDLLRGRHRRPRAAAPDRRRSTPTSTRPSTWPPGSWCPSRSSSPTSTTATTSPSRSSCSTSSTRSASRGCCSPARPASTRTKDGFEVDRGRPARPAVAVRADQADDGAGPRGHGGGHRPARDHPALLQPDRLRPRPRVRHLRQGALARARPAGDGGPRAEGLVHDHRHRAPDPRRHRHPRLHPRLGPGAGPRPRRRAVRRGARRGRRAEHGHQRRHR